MEDKFLTVEEINKLPDNKKVRRMKYIKIFLYIISLIISLALLGIGIFLIIVNKDVKVGGFLCVVFGAMLTFFLLASSILIFNGTIDKKYRDILLIQAIKEVLGSDAIFTKNAKVNKTLLKETGISPLDIEVANEQIVTILDNLKLSIISLKTINPLVTNVSQTIGATFEGGLAGFLLGSAASIISAANKETINRMFDGTLILIPLLKKKIDGVVEIRTKNFFSPVSYILNKDNLLEVESIKAHEKYNFYSKIKEEGFYIVVPEIIELFNKLDSIYKDGVVAIFKEDFIAIGVNNYHLNINKIYNNKNLSAKEMYFAIKDNLKILKEVDKTINFSIINR